MIHNLKSEVGKIKEITKPQEGSKHSFISIKKTGTESRCFSPCQYII